MTLHKGSRALPVQLTQKVNMIQERDMVMLTLKVNMIQERDMVMQYQLIESHNFPEPALCVLA